MRSEATVVTDDPTTGVSVKDAREVGIYKRKILRKKERTHAFDQEKK